MTRKNGMKRITVVVPEEVYPRASKVTGQGPTATIRKALEAAVARQNRPLLRKLPVK